MLNNIEQIKGLLDFSDPGGFYFIQIIQRRKDNPGLDKPEKVIKEYYVDNEAYLDSKMDSIISTCNTFNARATIRLNRRSYKKVAHKMLIDLAQKIDNEQYKGVKSSFASTCGKFHSDPQKKWLLDIDKEDLEGEGHDEFLDHLRMLLQGYQPHGEKMIALIKSNTGYHMLTKPFDMREFKRHYPTIEIHKDNPTNIYIP